MRAGYQVNEIFTSIQGEGVLAGVPSTFIRLQGCTVGCPWCDSLRTWGPLRRSKGYARGYVRGALAGDGWTDNKQRVQWQVTDIDFAQSIVDCLEIGFEYRTSIKRHDDWERHEKSDPAKEVFGIQCSTQKVVNDILGAHNANVEEQRGFVAGVFDAEGSINNEYQLLIWQKDPHLLKVVQQYMEYQSFKSTLHGPTSEGMHFLSIPKAESFLQFYLPRIERKWGKYAPVTSFKGGTRMIVEEIVARIDRPHVVITGGEPTLYNLDELIIGIRDNNVHADIQLETSGQQWLKGTLIPDWITWSPKKNLDYEGSKNLYDHAAEVKWVVDEELPLETVEHTWDMLQYRPRAPHFVLMPEGCPPRKEMVEKTFEWLAVHPTWRYGDRLQYRIGVK